MNDSKSDKSTSGESASLASGFSFDLGSQRRPDVDVVSGSELEIKARRVAESMYSPEAGENW